MFGHALFQSFDCVLQCIEWERIVQDNKLRRTKHNRSKCLKIECFLFKSERFFEMDALPVATSRRCVARISSFYFGAIFLFLNFFFYSLCVFIAVYSDRTAEIWIFFRCFGEIFDFINKSFFQLDLFLEELLFAILFRNWNSRDGLQVHTVCVCCVLKYKTMAMDRSHSLGSCLQ